MESVFANARRSVMPLMTLALGRGSAATTRAGAWRFLRAHIPEPELAGKLRQSDQASRRVMLVAKRDRAAAVNYRYMGRALRACKRFGLGTRDELDRIEIEVDIPKKVARMIRRNAEERYAYPIVVTRSDMPPRLEGRRARGGTWLSQRRASTRQIRVGYEWIMRVPELATVMIAARLGVEVK